MTKKIPPNYESCQGCPQWDDVNGCWNDINDVCDCDFVDNELAFNDDKYDDATMN